MARDGEGGPRDTHLARECYEKAAAQGDTLAMLSLGTLQLELRQELTQGATVTAPDGTVTTQPPTRADTQKAMAWFEKSAAGGDGIAGDNSVSFAEYVEGGVIVVLVVA